MKKPNTTDNPHSMVTLTKDGTRKAEVFLCILDVTETKNSKQAWTHKGWYNSVKLEFDAFCKQYMDLDPKAL